MKFCWKIPLFLKHLQLPTYVVAVILLTGCSSLFFYPNSRWLQTPAKFNQIYEDVNLRAQDGLTLSAWWLPASQAEGCVLFLHGNAKNMSTHLGSVSWLPKSHYHTLMLDYRGYGKSEGIPSIPAIFQDIDAATQELVNRCPHLPRYILAQSLGGALVTYYLGTSPWARSQLNAVVLDATFHDYSAIARWVSSRHWLSWSFQVFVPLVVPHRFDPDKVIANLSPLPLLMLHSKEDRIVPYFFGKKLYGKAKSPKTWIDVTGPHISTFRDIEARKKLVNFFADHERKRQTNFADAITMQ